MKKAYVGVGGKARLFYTSTLPPAIVDLWSTNSNGDTVKSITYANGYWVVGGSYRHANSNATTAQIAYTTSVNSPWTTVSVWETTSNNNTINCIAYANGYWMVGGEYRYKTSSYKARIAYATSLDGPWTIVDLWENYKSGGGVNDITYANGYWVVCGNYRGSSSNQATIAYATSPNSDWTTKDLWSSSSSYDGTATGIAYANGYWVVGGTYENSSDAFGRIAYATSLDGTWGKKMYGAAMKYRGLPMQMGIGSCADECMVPVIQMPELHMQPIHLVHGHNQSYGVASKILELRAQPTLTVIGWYMAYSTKIPPIMPALPMLQV